MSRVSQALAGIVAAGLLAACSPFGADGSGASGESQLVVAAASDLRLAFDELGAAFTADTGVTVRFSYGSSGQLAQQILNGAPFDVFASADAAFVDRVVAAGSGASDTVAVYGVGRIVLWGSRPRGAPPDLAALADTVRWRRIAIANPEHAPYGKAAQQALASAGVLDAVRPGLVLGENVSDTLRLATSGNVDAAIVALSLGIATPGGSWILIPGEMHDRLEQTLVVTSEHPAARRFAALVVSDAGREILGRYGFVAPDGPRFEDLDDPPIWAEPLEER